MAWLFVVRRHDMCVRPSCTTCISKTCTVRLAAAKTTGKNVLYLPQEVSPESAMRHRRRFSAISAASILVPLAQRFVKARIPVRALRLCSGLPKCRTRASLCDQTALWCLVAYPMWLSRAHKPRR